MQNNVTKSKFILFIYNCLRRFFVHIWPKENELSYIFIKKENEFSCLIGHNIISNGLFQAIRNNIGQKRELNSFSFLIKI